MLESARDRQGVALDLAVEVVYYPALDERLHAGMIERTILRRRILVASEGISIEINSAPLIAFVIVNGC